MLGRGWGGGVIVPALRFAIRFFVCSESICSECMLKILENFLFYERSHLTQDECRHKSCDLFSSAACFNLDEWSLKKKYFSVPGSLPFRRCSRSSFLKFSMHGGWFILYCLFLNSRWLYAQSGMHSCSCDTIFPAVKTLRDLG